MQDRLWLRVAPEEGGSELDSMGRGRGGGRAAEQSGEGSVGVLCEQRSGAQMDSLLRGHEAV